MTSPRIYEDPIGTEEVQEERGVSPDETREGLHEAEGDDDGVSDSGGDSDPAAGAGTD